MLMILPNSILPFPFKIAVQPLKRNHVTGGHALGGVAKPGIASTLGGRILIFHVVLGGKAMQNFSFGGIAPVAPGRYVQFGRPAS